MQIETTAAPATPATARARYSFCSDRCRERFGTDPDRFTHPEQADTSVDETPAGGLLDPVCGMTVDPQQQRTSPTRAAATTSAARAAAPRSTPTRSRTYPRRPTRSAAWTLTPPHPPPVAPVQHAGRTYLFCSTSCKDAFTADPDIFLLAAIVTGGRVDASS